MFKVAPLGNRALKAELTLTTENGPPFTCGGGAIFNIVGHANIHIGGVIRANNVEGGSSRE